MNKALKNIPKPDKEKLALFYGRQASDPQKSEKTPEQALEKSTVDKKATVDSVSTVDKTPTVDNKELKKALKHLINPNQQAVYLELVKRSYALGQNTISGWIGYTELARETGLCTKTIKRITEKLIQKNLIKRVDLVNTGEMKGSKYRVFLPLGMKLSPVDKMSTVDKTSTVDTKKHGATHKQEAT